MSRIENKLIGYAPDLPDTTPGVILDARNMYPSKRGFRALPSLTGLTQNTWPAATYGSVRGGAVVYPDANQPATVATAGWKFVGLATRIVNLNHSALPDVSRGGAYSLATTDYWSFCVMGRYAFATNPSTILQSFDTHTTYSGSTIGADFTDVSGAPKAEIIITAGPAASPFLIAFNYTDTVSGDVVPDGFFNSAVGNPFGWTRDLDQCSASTLEDEPGEITAAVPYRDGWVAFKNNSMYLGEYVAEPTIWQVRKVSSEIGCVSKFAVAVVDDKVFFLGDGGLYVFDGSYPRLVPGDFQEWFGQLLNASGGFSTLGSSYAPFRFWVSELRFMGCLVVGMPYDSTTQKYWFYNYNTGVMLPANFDSASGNNLIYWWIHPQLMFEGTLNEASPHWKWRYFSTGSSMVASDNWNYTREHYIDFGWIGDDNNMSTLKTVMPKWRQIYTGATLQYYSRNSRDGTRVQVGADQTPDARGWFDLLGIASNNAFHSVRLSIPAGLSDSTLIPELEGIIFDVVPSGSINAIG